MKECNLTVAENRKIAEGIWRMVLSGDVSCVTTPGQFVNIKLNGYYLRRPISVADKSESAIVLIYKVLGRGTRGMTALPVGTVLNVLTGLGNGYDLSDAGDAPLLVGGGVGIPPLYWLARLLREEGKSVHVAMGFNAADDVFYEEEFRALGCNVSIATVDGSYGKKGFVTNCLPEEYSYFYTCGPEAMLRAVYKATKTSGQLSFEERMGCGFGACMGCSCKTVTGYKRICKDGPVLRKEEILWED